MIRTISCFIYLVVAVAGAADTLESVVSVSSGGVSLGSYQGGYLFARALANQKKDKSKLKILTGASAGSINSLASLYYSFHHVSLDSGAYNPYTEWLKIGWEQLTAGQAAIDHPDHSLFTTDAIGAGMDAVISHLLTAPDQGFEDEKVRIGFAISRFLPPTVASSLNVHKANEKVILGLEWLNQCPDPAPEKRGKGCYRAWSEPFLDVAGTIPQPVFWFGPYGTDSASIAKALKRLALASSAFPIAFPPTWSAIYGLTGKSVLLHWSKIVHSQAGNDSFCLRRFDPHHLDAACSEPSGNAPDRVSDSLDRVCSKLYVLQKAPGAICPTDTSSMVDSFTRLEDSTWGRWDSIGVKFSDGGLYDNQPLELAMRIQDNQQRIALGNSDTGYRGKIEQVRLLVPTHYPTDFPNRLVRRGMGAEWILLLLNRRPDATELELLKGLEHEGVDTKNIVLNTTSLPLASEHFMHFSGFYQERFRRFDFLVGYIDGIKDPKPLKRASSNLKTQKTGIPWLDSALQNSVIQKITNDSFAYSLWRPDSIHDTGSNIFDALLDEIQNEHKLLEKQPGAGNQNVQALLDVFSGSLLRLEGSIKSIRAKEDESDADRYRNFIKGLSKNHCSISPFSDHPRIPSKPLSDQMYHQIYRMFDSDAYGSGNSVAYPLSLFHLREGMAFLFGEKPLWSAPYLRMELATPGIRVLQGFSLFDGSWWYPLGGFRGELGLFPAWEDDKKTMRIWQTVRVGYEIPISRFFSLVPSYTADFGLTDQTSLYRAGIDLLAIDLIQFEVNGYDFRKGWNLSFSGGVRLGFDILAISEGLRNGFNNDRSFRK